uniref:Putative secreted protein n=1 Tax=Anopheles marajoara TaxID=58244 RepID=A0A2M4CDH0_9DIPT
MQISMALSIFALVANGSNLKRGLLSLLLMWYLADSWNSAHPVPLAVISTDLMDSGNSSFCSTSALSLLTLKFR